MDRHRNADQLPYLPLDTDGDGRPDFEDDDDDGVLTADEDVSDTDGDGVPDYLGPGG